MYVCECSCVHEGAHAYVCDQAEAHVNNRASPGDDSHDKYAAGAARGGGGWVGNSWPTPRSCQPCGRGAAADICWCTSQLPKVWRRRRLLLATFACSFSTACLDTVLVCLVAFALVWVTAAPGWPLAILRPSSSFALTVSYLCLLASSLLTCLPVCLLCFCLCQSSVSLSLACLFTLLLFVMFVCACLLVCIFPVNAPSFKSNKYLKCFCVSHFCVYISFPLFSLIFIFIF